MNWPVQIFYVVLTVSLAVKSSSSASHDQGPRLLANHHSMRWSVGGGAPANHHSMRLSAAHHTECGAGGTITACAGVRGSRASVNVFSFNASLTESPSFISSYFLTPPLFFILCLTVSMSSFFHVIWGITSSAMFSIIICIQ
jgi:hypothetical protein